MPAAQPDDLLWKAFDAAQNFNDRTLQTLAWIGGTLVVLITAAIGLSAYNLNSEKDRIERALTLTDERFAKLALELKGLRTEAPQLEILSTLDKLPIAGRPVQTNIFLAEQVAGKPYQIKLQYTIRNIGKGSAGRIWTKVYMEPKGMFGGEPNPDEAGYGSQSIIPHTAWTGDYAGTYGDFPGGGFSTNVSSNLAILKDTLPKGRYKVLLKIYYGSPESRVERVETYFDLPNAWVRPKP